MSVERIFYTRPLPYLVVLRQGKCERRRVLMHDTSIEPSTEAFVTTESVKTPAVVWLYRGQTDRYLHRIQEYMMHIQNGITSKKRGH